MKILVFSWRDQAHPWAGGSELNLFSQIRYWKEWGHQVTVFTSTYPNAETHDTIDGAEIYRKGNQFSHYFWAIYFYWRFFQKKYDVILDIMNAIPFFTPLFTREPKVCLVHHMSTEQIHQELKQPLNILAEWLQTKFFPFVYKNTPMISVSESTSGDMIRFGFKSQNISLIHNGLDHELLRPDRKKTAHPSIIYLGRLKKYKRIERLINAFAEVSKRIPESRLTIVGSGNEKNELEKMVREKNLNQAVNFRGFVSETEKVQILSESWMYVTPSIVEGWGLAVLEAAACGTPAIAFNVPGLNKAIIDGQTGYLVRNQQELVSSMIKVLQDQPLRTKLSRQAQAWSEQFNWEDTAKKTIKLFEHVASSAQK